MNEVEIVPVSVKLTKEELKEFDEAIKRSKRFLNRSDAIRSLIRDFVEKSRVENRRNGSDLTEEVANHA